LHTPTHQPHIIDANTAVEDTEEYVEESLSLTDAERDMIIRALEKHNGNRRRAAEELNISQRTLYRRINEYGLE
jgi:transcriptional regulator with PAS, ATPase and Fis domain